MSPYSDSRKSHLRISADEIAVDPAEGVKGVKSGEVLLRRPFSIDELRAVLAVQGALAKAAKTLPDV